MAAIDFPASPANGAMFTPANGVTYRWVTPPGIWTTANGPADTVIASDTPPSNPAPNQLWFNASLAMLYVYYDDGNSQQWVPSMPVPAPVIAPVRTKVTRFIANGTFTPDANCVHGYAVGKGGGGGGSNNTVSAGGNYGSSGGAEGTKVTTYFTLAQVLPSVAVVIGAGGAVDFAGGQTSFGALLIAKGGGQAVDYRYAGVPGTTGNVGDDIEFGAPGGQGNGYATTGYGYMNAGSGGGAGGGPGVGTYNGQYLYGLAGTPNSGGGGGGACCCGINGAISGGAGGSGYLYVVEYLK